jgi:hypothetical protein
MLPMRLAILLLLFTSSLAAQPTEPAYRRGAWKAAWISAPGIPQRDYAVIHLRKSITLAAKPDRYRIHVSADNRYRLFVNGHEVCRGPARGDLAHWYFETIDIAPWLQPGRNTLAATVWNMGTLAPVAQISNQTAFLLQGDSPAEESANTDKSWKTLHDSSYTSCSIDNGQRLRSYMVVGPGDRVDAGRHPWGWEQPGYDDSRWTPAIPVGQAVTFGYGTDNLWTLTPRNIPLMRMDPERLAAVRRSTGTQATDAFLQGRQPITIPPHTTSRILLDNGHLTVAYPTLHVSGGKGASVTLTYAEALFDKDRQKGNRNVIEGKEILGNYDSFLPDGGTHRSFQPLWLRTYRFLQLDIQTADQPLTLDDLSAEATGYPFPQKASFSSNDSSLRRIWDIGWRTALLCAGETYYDCPYYEQLQYEGDTRIQSLISLYVAGDDRLMRKAILDFHRSRIPEGLTQGRYPSNRLQVIPPFSLYWVSMIHDYWMHRTDDAFLKPLLPAVSQVIDWYENHIDRSKGMLGPMEWWNFVDWNQSFPSGTPDGATNGNSSVLSLQLAYTLRQAEQLFRHYGSPTEAERCKSLSAKLIAGTRTHCYNAARKVMANTPQRNTYSQHASIMALLTDAVPAADRKAVMNQILTDTTLSQATFYYRFYLTRALRHIGMADLYYSQLTPWRGMIANGLTTFAENPDPTRSDCHAWSSSPNYDFLATLCGIRPSAPGFSAVSIEPALGELTEVKGSMPHPLGEIRVHLKRKGKDGLEGEVSLPDGIPGTLRWNGKSLACKGRTPVSL